MVCLLDVNHVILSPLLNLKNKSMSEGNIINSEFETAYWLPERHSQTLFPTLFRRPSPLLLTEEDLELPDGDFR